MYPSTYDSNLGQQAEVVSMCECLNVLLLREVPIAPYPTISCTSFHPNYVSSEGEDYLGTEFQVPFPEGVTKATFSIPIVDDSVFEPDEYFSIELEIPQAAQDIGVMKGNSFMANVTITNDECEFSLLTYPSLPASHILVHASAHFSIHSRMQ